METKTKRAADSWQKREPCTISKVLKKYSETLKDLRIKWSRIYKFIYDCGTVSQELK